MWLPFCTHGVALRDDEVKEDSYVTLRSECTMITVRSSVSLKKEDCLKHINSNTSCVNLKETIAKQSNCVLI